MLNKVMSFIIVETEANQMVNSRFINSAGYKLIDIMNDGVKAKHVYAWDSEYGVYLYWDSDFVEGLQYLSRKFVVSGMVWDSNIGLVWFDSKNKPEHGVVNLNLLFQDEQTHNEIVHVENIIDGLSEEEQALICLTLPWMSGFFSNVQRVVKAVKSLEPREATER